MREEAWPRYYNTPAMPVVGRCSSRAVRGARLSWQESAHAWHSNPVSKPASNTSLAAPLLRHVDGIAEIGCLLVCSATIGALLASRFWITELLTHFRVQYTACLAVAAAWWLVRRHPWRAAVCAVLAGTNAFCWVSLYKPAPRPTPPTKALRVMALNVLTSNHQFEQVRALLEREQPDLLLLQEVNQAWMENLTAISNQFPHNIAVPREDNFGIALLSSIPFVSAVTTNLDHSMVPTVDAVMDVQGHRLRLLGLHALPPASKDGATYRDAQLAACGEILQAEAGPVILTGDFNATPWSPCLRKLRRVSGLLDSMQGYGPQASWPTYLWPLLIPLDHLYHSAHIQVVDRRLDTSSGSDHAALIVDVQLPAAGGAAP